MSSLIPERPLVISPSLAATIGLEEAILLQVLNDVALLGKGQQQQGRRWFTITANELQPLLPFWQYPQVCRISQSLADKGIILINNDRNQAECLSFAMNEATETSTSKLQSPRLIDRSPPTPGARLINDSWQPDEDLLQLLMLNHNIPRDFALQQREDFILYWKERRQVSHSWSSKFRQHVLAQWRFHQSQQAVSTPVPTTASDINTQWYPSPDALEILLRADISRDFIDDAIPEFVLYWRERGQAHSTWNSKFIAHIRRQWAQFTKTMELDYEPREIPSNWQPNEDVYDILKLANIDVSFARQLVPEFVLFWRDTKQIQRSWNTKFLQHAKYQWATRHQMEQHYAGQQLPAKTGQPERKSTFDRLTDRSWAKDLIEGS